MTQVLHLPHRQQISQERANSLLKMDFSYAQKTVSFAHVGIDPGYFKTLNISSIQGNTTVSIDQLLRDSLANYAIINESAAKNLGLENPIGAKNQRL